MESNQLLQYFWQATSPEFSNLVIFKVCRRTKHYVSIHLVRVHSFTPFCAFLSFRFLTDAVSSNFHTIRPSLALKPSE